MAMEVPGAFRDDAGGIARRCPDSGRAVPRVGSPARNNPDKADDVSTRYLRMPLNQPSSLARQAGGTTLGILIGIVLGLAIAVVTALFVTKTTLPFLGLSAKSGDKPGATAVAAPPTAAVPEAPKPQVPVAAGDVPDPNRPGASRERAAPGQPPVERRDIATVTAAPQPPPPAPAPAVAPGAASAPIRAATPSLPATVPGTAPAPQAAVAATDRGATYLLQAGAFRGVDDADAMKLRLALMGLEAQIVSADISGTTLYRVRVGPYAGLDAMNRARARLAENGVEATVLRQR
jgi:cell division protein FtsN